MHRRFLGSAATSPPYNNYNNGNRTGDSYISEANFDTNMVIILAALLFALICALGLNSIVRCALRCSHRFALETPEQAAVRLAATGLKKSHLRRIPVAVYCEEGSHVPATECPICLGEFEDGDKIRVLPKCNHGFHVRCIDTWLVSHSSCPNCRHSLLEHQQPPKKARTTGRSTTRSSSHEATESSSNTTSDSDQEGRVVVVVNNEQR